MPEKISLSDNREKLFRRWVREANTARVPLLVFSRDLVSYLNDTDKYIKDGTRLRSRYINTAKNKIERNMESIKEAMDLSFRRSFSNSMYLAADRQIKYLKSLGFVSNEKITPEIMSSYAINNLDSTFFIDGLSYSDRLDWIIKEHKNQLNRIVDQTYLDSAKRKVTSNIKYGLSFMEKGKSPVLNGSMSKKIMRLFVSEKARLTRDVELSVMKSFGVGLANWRLSPMHKDHGGVCEKLAEGSDPSAVEYAKKQGAAFDSNGLYFVNDWPAYPHPFCKCFAEPVI